MNTKSNLKPYRPTHITSVHVFFKIAPTIHITVATITTTITGITVSTK